MHVPVSGVSGELTADWEGREDKVQMLGLVYLTSSPTLLTPAEAIGLWPTSSMSSYLPH